MPDQERYEPPGKSRTDLKIHLSIFFISSLLVYIFAPDLKLAVIAILFVFFMHLVGFIASAPGNVDKLIPIIIITIILLFSLSKIGKVIQELI